MSCTSNINLKKNDNWYVMTAWHCWQGTKKAWWSGNSPWQWIKYPGGHAVMKRSGHSFMRRSVGAQLTKKGYDIGGIWIESGANGQDDRRSHLIFSPSPSRNVEALAAPVEGNTACYSGMHTMLFDSKNQTTCGKIVYISDHKRWFRVKGKICAGDSGGPIFYKRDNNRAAIVGLQSNGRTSIGNRKMRWKQYAGRFSKANSSSKCNGS